MASGWVGTLRLMILGQGHIFSPGDEVLAYRRDAWGGALPVGDPVGEPVAKTVVGHHGECELDVPLGGGEFVALTPGSPGRVRFRS